MTLRKIAASYQGSHSLSSKMVSRRNKVKKGSEMLVRGVKWKAPDFKFVLEIAETLDSSGA